MRNRIWTELTQSKHNIEFTTLYSDRQRFTLRIFNIVISVFSSAGIMGWEIWEKLPLIACVLIAGISLMRLLQPNLITNEKQLNNLDKIHKFYTKYNNRIEELWYEFYSGRIDEKEATNKFFEIKNTESDINPLIAETIRRKPNRIEKKAKKNSDEYFNQLYNT